MHSLHCLRTTSTKLDNSPSRLPLALSARPTRLALPINTAMAAPLHSSVDPTEPVKLFTPIKLREIEVKNRIFLAPMCQYSAVDGIPNEWHLAHLGARAIGGFGLIIAEATGVVPEGRITHGCTGIWSDEHTKAWQPIARFIKSAGSIPGIQLAHAGRKASSHLPWVKNGASLQPDENPWQTVAPSPLTWSAEDQVPKEMTIQDIDDAVEAFRKAAQRSLEAGFQVVELHFAHGYLAHNFLSPRSNHRTDEYGGLLENRMRFPLRIAAVVREVWPKEWPVLVRLSATEWADPASGPSWDLPQSIELSKRLKDLGIDLIDVSSGGNLEKVTYPVGLGYQVPLAAAIRKEAEIPTGAVGLITTAQQAEQILQNGEADAVFLARASLRDPNWPHRAASELGVPVKWPVQYERAGKFR